MLLLFSIVKGLPNLCSVREKVDLNDSITIRETGWGRFEIYWTNFTKKKAYEGFKYDITKAIHGL